MAVHRDLMPIGPSARAANQREGDRRASDPKAVVCRDRLTAASLPLGELSCDPLAIGLLART
jgi:hypothetical protein